MDWIRAIGKDPGPYKLMKAGSFFGELRTDEITESLHRMATVSIQLAVIRINDLYVERDGKLYMGYDWLNTPLGEITYEKYYRSPSKFLFVPRVIINQEQEIERFITVDVCDHYVNPI